jgi:putative membrane protein
MNKGVDAMKYRIFSVLLALPVFVFGGCYGDGYWNHMGEWPHGAMQYWFGGFFMWIIGLIIIGLLVYFIVAALRSRTERRPPEQKETPMDVLRMRFARGEITKEQFEEMRRDLQE